MYQGRDGFEWFTGIIEDRTDPMFLNRVRVRIFGAHTHDKQLIATADLPWCEVMMPVTSPSLSGLGTTTHGLVEGSFVIGFYRDKGSQQDPIIMGSLIGIPGKFSRVDEKIDDKGTRNYTKVDRKPTEGFNDPRLDSASSYKGTPDGPNPEHIQRSYGLTLGLDKSPRRDGETKGVLYPKESYYGTSSVNLLARATDHESENNAPVKDAYPIIKIETGEGDGVRDDTTYLKPKYPFNHVFESESGHVFEIDDTPDYERIHLFHRTGSRYEIDKDGNRVEKIIKDAYTVVLGNDTVTVTGDVVVNVTGNSYVNTTGNTALTTGGNTTVTTTGNTLVDTTGTTTVNSTGNTDVTTPETLITSNVKIDGTLNVTGAQTNDSTITAEDEITGKGVKLSTHTHTISSGSSAGKTLLPD